MGRLITIEGLDGAGKTTLARGWWPRCASAASTRAPCASPAAWPWPSASARVVKDPELRVGARAEALLYAAARAQLVEEALRPLLDAGAWVVLDRFLDSSLAYQGAGRGLGIDAVRAINLFGTGGLQPDRTLLLRIDPVQGRARQAGRGEAPDRLEREADAFFRTIAAAYDELAAAEPERIRVLDATLPPAAVLSGALDAMADLL